EIAVVAGVFNMICNIVLFVFKLAVGVMSESVTVTVDAFNNLSDVGFSLVTIFGFKLSNKPASKKHPFGYGRIEYIIGILISIFIILVGLEFIKSSIGLMIEPVNIEINWFMIFFLVIAIFIKLWMGFSSIKFGKLMSGSTTMKAMAVDSLTDVACTAVGIISIVVSGVFRIPIDGWLGFLVALIVIIMGIRVLIDTISPLLGQTPDPEMVVKLKQKVLGYPQIVGVHDITIHSYGPNFTMATLHAEVPSDNNIIFAHEVIDKAEREISDSMGINLLIHLDPIVTDDKRLNEFKTLVESCLNDISKEYTMHDFRMVDGQNKINLIFDVEVPYSSKKSDDEIISEITEQVVSSDKRLNPIITIDKNFV
ncbi:MAG: cation diffusion facilitator family transporter, partial [Oscillospiraceae bacterium]|nr:cation diffusion facilitator family transporter [Oscillospiraceae bacterium]